jgi:SAM-dependent methyltransferase
MSGIQIAEHESAIPVAEADPALPKRSSKDRSQFVAVLQKCVRETELGINDQVLVVGGMQEDAAVLRRCGFSRITLSNITGTGEGSDETDGLPVIAVDAEEIRIPDNSYDVLFVHEVIHHCRSPHRALCEMLRVARRQVVMMEPNESAFMSLLTRLGFSFPYEIAAVVNNDYMRGGVRNSQIPNFIFRWNARSVHQLASAFLAEYKLRIYADPYWDFNANEGNLADRKQTRIGMVTRIVGAKNFLRILRTLQRVLNAVPVLRRQGNKFFCCIQKSAELQPWLRTGSGGEVIFDRSYQRKRQAPET